MHSASRRTQGARKVHFFACRISAAEDYDAWPFALSCLFCLCRLHEISMQLLSFERDGHCFDSWYSKLCSFLKEAHVLLVSCKLPRIVSVQIKVCHSVIV